MEAVYRFDQMKSQPAEVRRPLRKLTLSVPQRSDLAAGEAAAARGLAIAHGMNLTRDPGNLPPNICTPTYLAERAEALAKELGFSCQVLDRPQLEELKMDAEGRLILCDALTYAERYEPAAVVDIATLTGAMVVALGHIAMGVFSNSDSLARALVTAGEEAFDRAWQMPLWDDYHEALNSNFADFANIGNRAGGGVTAACFLSKF